jgi:signal transduction histidine kinase
MCGGLETPVIINTAYSSYRNDFTTWSADAYIVKGSDTVVDLIQKTKELFPIGDLKSDTSSSKKLSSIITEESKIFYERTEQIYRKKDEITTSSEAEQYRAICGAVAHSLRGEFVQIGHSIKSLRELAGSSPDVQEDCDMIERGIQYSQILLRRLFDYLDIGMPRVESIDAVELLKKTEMLAKPRLPSNVQLEIKIDHSTKQRAVLANFEQVIGILLELVYNAVSALRDKGGTIEIELAESGSEIAIFVKDNGTGISEEIKQELFKKQVPSKSGLGLGLFLCNKVVTALGGKLNLQTSSEKGTTFTILLPTAANKKGS